jgi:hypothetical protein
LSFCDFDGQVVFHASWFPLQVEQLSKCALMLQLLALWLVLANFPHVDLFSIFSYGARIGNN